MDRRSILAAGGVLGLTSLAGCTNSVRAFAPGHGGAKLDSEPPTVPETHKCDRSAEELFPNASEEELEDFQRLGERIQEAERDRDVALGRRRGWSLEIGEQEVNYGDTVSFTLWRTGIEVSTGVRSMWHIERLTEQGWEDVRVPFSRRARPLKEVNHSGGTIWEWEITLTEEGIIDAYGDDGRDEVVCPDLETGRYRFVYCGLGADWCIGVEFDLFR